MEMQMIETTGTEIEVSQSAVKAMKTPLHETFEKAIASISRPFVRRADIANGLMIATLAGEHVLLLGPPGTAKSDIARRFAAHFDEANHFDWLLTKFSQPEEIFGPVSIAGLKAGRYERVPTGKLPEADFAFLDEIFKANSSILNALLTAANERKWHDGVSIRDIPLKTIVGASNETPENETLDAFFDRFLLRYFVAPVATSNGAFHSLMAARDADRSVTETISRATLAKAQKEVRAVNVDEAVKAMAEVADLLRAKGVSVTDRRWMKAIRIVQARAWLDGQTEASNEDLDILAHVLWTKPDDIETVRDVVQARAAAAWAKQAETVRALASRYEEISSKDFDDRRFAAYLRDGIAAMKQMKQVHSAATSPRAKSQIEKAAGELRAILKDAKTRIEAAAPAKDDDLDIKF